MGKRKKKLLLFVLGVGCAGIAIGIFAKPSGPRFMLDIVPDDSMIYQREILFTPSYLSVFSWESSYKPVQAAFEQEMRRKGAQLIAGTMWRLPNDTFVELRNCKAQTEGGYQYYVRDRSWISVTVRHGESEGPLDRLRGWLRI
jgi:hypothetical protein